MPVIRRVEVERFRGIEFLSWDLLPGVNCLIGPGDSCKSTVLDAIDLTLGARRQISLTDADFHMLNVENPIVIRVTLGDLDDGLHDLDAYGLFLRGWDPSGKTIAPEPGTDLEPILTVELRVEQDLEPRWRLFSERGEDQGVDRDLAWKDRQRLAPTRLGAFAGQHFAWGQRSVLNRLSPDRAEISSALARASREARKAFSTSGPALGNVANDVGAMAKDLGVPAESIQALLDVEGISLSGGAVALHDKNSIPLRMLGLGSSRMLVAAMLKKAAEGHQILIVDEVELGLEPHRIHRLLNWLGAKDEKSGLQVLLSTHSPVVLRELSVGQLAVLRRADDSGNGAPRPHRVNYAGDFDQAAIRACTEGFLARRVIVCEGKTEMGMVRGQDQFYSAQGGQTMLAEGVLPVDAGGSEGVRRARSFAELGYPTALFRDSDVELSAKNRRDLGALGVAIFEWARNQSTEDAFFAELPPETCTDLLSLAIKLRGKDKVRADLDNAMADIPFECPTPLPVEVRSGIAEAAKRGKWFKTISAGERLMKDVVMPGLDALPKKGSRKVLADLRAWVRGSHG